MPHNKYQYTLVEHSELPNAVEMRVLTTKSDHQKVSRISGVILATYNHADEAEYAVNSLIETEAKLSGGFSKKMLDGKKIFIPSPKVHAKLKELA